MAYKMTEITPQIRVGQTGKGDFDIEVWTPSFQDADAGCVEVIIPANAASALGKFLMLKS